MLHAMAERPGQQIVVLSQARGLQRDEGLRLRICALCPIANPCSQQRRSRFSLTCICPRSLFLLQVLAADINVGFEEIVNTQVGGSAPEAGERAVLSWSSRLVMLGAAVDTLAFAHCGRHPVT